MLDADALAAYQEAVRERQQKPAGTLAAVAASWRASASWAALAPGTRREWGRVLAAVEAKWGFAPLSVFDDRRMRGKIVAWRDTMADTPRKADYHMQVLRALLAYARLLGEVAVNMADGVPQLYKGGNRAAIIWEPDEIARWQECPNQAIRDGVNFARLTGLRRGDLVAVPLSAVKRDALVWQTSKSGRTTTVSVPILPALRDLLRDLETRPRAAGVQTLLANSFGQSWTPAGFTTSFIAERGRLGLPGKHLHDMRGTFATELCLAGLTDEQIAGVFGWSPGTVAEIRRLYVDQAATVVAIGERLANSAVKRAVKQPD